MIKGTDDIDIIIWVKQVMIKGFRVKNTKCRSNMKPITLCGSSITTTTTTTTTTTYLAAISRI